MRLSKAKNIFTKVLKLTDSKIYLLNLNGKIIDSNDFENIGEILEVPDYQKNSKFIETDLYIYSYVKRFDSPQLVIALKKDSNDYKKDINFIDLIFNDEKKEMSKNEFLRELLIGNIDHMTFDENVNKYSIDTAVDNLRNILIKMPHEQLKNTKLIVDNIFIFDDNIILNNEMISIITKKPLDEVQELCLGLFSEISSQIGIEPKICIGSAVDNYFKINQSLKDSIDVFRLAEKFKFNSDLYLYDEFLIPLVLDDLSDKKLIKFNREIQQKYKEIFEDRTLINTAKKFFEYNLNITETAKKLFIHRNTLIYRINKIKEITELDLKKFEDAMKFYVMLLIRNLAD